MSCRAPRETANSVQLSAGRTTLPLRQYHFQLLGEGRAVGSFPSPNTIAYFSPDRAGIRVLFKALESAVELGFLLVGQLKCFGGIRDAVPDCLNNPNSFGYGKLEYLVKRD